MRCFAKATGTLAAFRRDAFQSVFGVGVVVVLIAVDCDNTIVC